MMQYTRQLIEGRRKDAIYEAGDQLRREDLIYEAVDKLRREGWCNILDR